MRKKLYGFALGMCLCLAACGSNKEDAANGIDSTISSEISISEDTSETSLDETNDEATDVATNDVADEAKDTESKEDEMSGELIQENEDLTVEQEAETLVIEMDEVADTLCPASISKLRSDVSYGIATRVTYESTTTGCERAVKVLLPPGYDKSKEYPVLYFLHGIFGDENSMLGDGNNRIKEIVVNLKEDGYIEDIIVVFPDMYATSDPNLKPGFSAEQTAPYDNFINDLTNDLIPFIEENYSVRKDREGRAIIGFSMGGRESLYIGVSRSDLFDCIGAIAPAPGLTPGKDWAMEHPGTLSEDELVIKMTDYMPKLLMVCCGTKDSVVGQFPLSYHNIMTDNGVDHLWYEVPGADHDNNAIKSGLYNFLVRWFLK